MIESSPTNQSQFGVASNLFKTEVIQNNTLPNQQKTEQQAKQVQKINIKQQNSQSSGNLHYSRKLNNSNDFQKNNIKKQLDQIEYMVNLNEKYYTQQKTEKLQQDKNSQYIPTVPEQKQIVENNNWHRKNVLPINVRNSQPLLYQRGKKKRIQSQKIELAFYNSPHHEKLHLGNTFFPPKPTSILSDNNSPIQSARPGSDQFDQVDFQQMQNSQTFNFQQSNNSTLLNQQRMNSPTSAHNRACSSQKTFRDSNLTQQSNNYQSNFPTPRDNQPCMDIKYIEYLSTPIVFKTDFKKNQNCPHRLVGRHKKKQEQIQLIDIFNNQNNQGWPNFNINCKTQREKTPGLQIEAHLNYNTSQKSMIDKSLAPVILKKGNINSNTNMPKFATDLETLGNFTIAKKNLIQYINNLKKL